MLQTKFVPVAIDQFAQRQQKDAEGDFWRKIVKQGPRPGDNNQTTQGLYTITADGELLAFNNNRGPWKVKDQLTAALKQYKSNQTRFTPLKVENPDPRFQKKPPEGSIVVHTHAKVLGGYEKTEDDWRKIFQRSVSRDNLWILPEESEALSQGKFLPALSQRLIRYHLIDNTRGEPTFWKPKEVKLADLTIDAQGQIRGTIKLEREDGSSGYQANLLGKLAFTEGKLTQFDLVAHGDYWGAGRYTRKPPEGKFPLGVSFRIPATPSSFDDVPPQGTKGWAHPYLAPNE